MVGIACFASARILTPQECERLIHQDPTWLTDFYLHTNARQAAYLLPNAYGILATDSTVDYVYQHTPIACYYFPSRLPMKVFFGYGLKYISGLAERYEIAGTHLHCISLCKGPSLSMDICCLCDGKKKHNSQKNLMDQILKGLDSITKAYYDQTLRCE